MLNSDIVMIFDECTPYPADRKPPPTRCMSLRWAERSRKAFDDLHNPNALFGIAGAACTWRCAGRICAS